MSQDRYRLSPREAYVLRSAPIHGLVQAGKARRHGEAVPGNARTMWMIGDEHLSDVVERLLLRDFLARRRGAASAYADLTAEGRTAIRAPDGGVPMTRISVTQMHPPGDGWRD